MLNADVQRIREKVINLILIVLNTLYFTLKCFVAVKFINGCKWEVRWMYQHLDLDSDGKLSLQELYDLEHDKNEMCIKPFLDTCDTDGYEFRILNNYSEKYLILYIYLLVTYL